MLLIRFLEQAAASTDMICEQKGSTAASNLQRDTICKRVLRFGLRLRDSEDPRYRLSGDGYTRALTDSPYKRQRSVDTGAQSRPLTRR